MIVKVKHKSRERVPSSQVINGLDGGVAVKSEKECVGCEGTAIGKYCSRSGSEEALTLKEVRPRAGTQTGFPDGSVPWRPSPSPCRHGSSFGVHREGSGAAQCPSVLQACCSVVGDADHQEGTGSVIAIDSGHQ